MIVLNDIDTTLHYYGIGVPNLSPARRTCMGKVITFLAAMLLLAMLLVAQLYPGSPLFWVASTTMIFTVLRYTLIVVLLWLLIQPPRAKWLREPLALVESLFSLWLVGASYLGAIQFIDSLTLMSAAAAICLELLESKPKDEPFRFMESAAAIRDISSDNVQILFSWGKQFAWLFLTDLNLIIEKYLHIDKMQVPKQYAVTDIRHHVGSF